MRATVVLTTSWLSQFPMSRGISSRLARGVRGSAPLILGGLIMLMPAYLNSSIGKVALLVVGGGLTGSIYRRLPGDHR
jgi:hypothetical protein